MSYDRQNTEPVSAKNPKGEVVDHYWRQLKQDLDARRGRTVKETMDEIKEEDRWVWNACFWRIRNYFKAFFTNQYPYDEPGRNDYGTLDLSQWLWLTYPERDDDHYGVMDLPYLVQELDKAPSVLQAHRVRVGGMTDRPEIASILGKSGESGEVLP